MIEIKSSNAPSETDREPLFSIDGMEYTIPREVSGAFAMEALEKTATLGELPGARWIMIELMGRKAYDALRQCKGVSQADLLAIMEICRMKAFGDAEREGKG